MHPPPCSTQLNRTNGPPGCEPFGEHHWSVSGDYQLLYNNISLIILPVTLQV